ncbi:MAG TPA: helix-turn-helix domain-containing protein [Friedmanniella sp.]
MRADARENRDRVLEAAGEVFAAEGADASLRLVAREADVGLATLLRHFPSRDALLEALLRTGFSRLAARGAELRDAHDARVALLTWLRDFVECADTYRGVVVAMTAAIEDPQSALHAACVEMRTSGADLLVRAQEAGAVRRDLDGTDLFLLAGGIAWTYGQGRTTPQRAHLLDVQLEALLAQRSSAGT